MCLCVCVCLYVYVVLTVSLNWKFKHIQMQSDTDPPLVEVCDLFFFPYVHVACWLFLWNRDDAVPIKSHHVLVWQRAREGCGFGYSSTFLKEKTWWQGADGADEVWANFVCYALFLDQTSLLSTVKVTTKFTLLTSQRARQERRRARLCLREGTGFLLSMNQIFCAPAKLSARHSSLCFGQRELIRPASSDVVLLPWTPSVTVCATVPSAQQKPSRHYSHNSQVTS